MIPVNRITGTGIPMIGSRSGGGGAVCAGRGKAL